MKAKLLKKLRKRYEYTAVKFYGLYSQEKITLWDHKNKWVCKFDSFSAFVEFTMGLLLAAKYGKRRRERERRLEYYRELKRKKNDSK